MEAFEIANKYYRERPKVLRNVKRNLNIIVKKAKEILGDTEVYLFGSYVKGNFKPFLSDIDVLIVSDKVPEKVSKRSEIKLKIEKAIEGFSIF